MGESILGGVDDAGYLEVRARQLRSLHRRLDGADCAQWMFFQRARRQSNGKRPYCLQQSKDRVHFTLLISFRSEYYPGRNHKSGPPKEILFG